MIADECHGKEKAGPRKCAMIASTPVLPRVFPLVSTKGQDFFWNNTSDGTVTRHAHAKFNMEVAFQQLKIQWYTQSVVSWFFE